MSELPSGESEKETAAESQTVSGWSRQKSDQQEKVRMNPARHMYDHKHVNSTRLQHVCKYTAWKENPSFVSALKTYKLMKDNKKQIQFKEFHLKFNFPMDM